jgi:hypothetical protein
VTTQIATASCVARSGVSPDGVKVTARELVERATWLANISSSITHRILSQRWNEEAFAVVETGVDASGVTLASKAYVALRSLGWREPATEGVYVPDRVFRCAEEKAMRSLRSAQHRSRATNVVVASWPTRPNFADRNRQKRTANEWSQLTQAEGNAAPLDRVTIRNRTRAVASFVRANGYLPTHVTELEDTPRVAPQVVLAAADKRLVSLTHVSDTQAVLRVKLPLTPSPASRNDWEEVLIEFTLGNHLPPDAVLSTPTLRVVNNQVRLDTPYTRWVPEPLARSGKKHAGHSRAIGVDWGVNTLLTAVSATIDDTRGTPPVVRTDGRVYEFGMQGPALKLHRLRKLSEDLSTKIAHLKNLLNHTPAPLQPPLALVNKHAVLVEERRRVSLKRTHLGREIAWAGATWLVDLAVASRATVIYVEDLRTMESRGTGRTNNVRCSNQVRGVVLTALRHQAMKHGITVVSVPARGTSSQCPRCLHKLKHVAAPDRVNERGHAWAFCRNCGLSANRDHAAAQRIASRGLAAQHSAFLDTNKNWCITRTVDVRVRLTRTNQTKHRRVFHAPSPRRDKTTPTPKQPSRGFLGRVPARRSTPANNARALFQRPAGTTVSNTPPSGVEQPGLTFSTVTTQTKHASTRRERCLGGRGFHPLSHPSRVPRASQTATPSQ